MATPKAKVDPKFELTVRSLKENAAKISQATLDGDFENISWNIPANHDWDGDLSDLEGISKLFPRADANQMFIDAIKDSSDPGTSGDMILSALQVDYLGCLERAFRARHTMSPNRALAHATARQSAHGADTGPLVQLVLEYIRSISKQNGTING